ncbi:hypothetical protein OB919_21535 [Halobacteria archaeon AArc-curdl1]|uniref:Uncharacterized protein n=1 Tax=Natronosalvus hydrolyticus TaxID=2979988 RepID=A0AAP2ZC30_9EURY|nr:hypothetical protein [Halobacteria archaeon AArc-curdl1]
MGTFDPVSWETVEATIGPPAPEVTEHVEKMRDEVYGIAPYDAVKTIHDALYADEVNRTVPNLGEPFVTAYLLEKQGIISPNDDDAPENEYRSLVERRPDSERLRELFWERERTLWWIGVMAGIHPSLVTYWFYEDDIPLMERNFSEESLEQIHAYQESDDMQGY